MQGIEAANNAAKVDNDFNIRENVTYNVHKMISEMGVEWQHLCGRPHERKPELYTIFEHADNLPKQTNFSKYWSIKNTKYELKESICKRFVDFINATFEFPQYITVEDFRSKKLEFKLPDTLKAQVNSFYKRSAENTTPYQMRFLHKYTLLYYSGGVATVGYLKIKNVGTKNYCTIVTGFTTILENEILTKIDKWMDTVLLKGDSEINNNASVTQWLRNENVSFYYGPVEIHSDVLVIYASEVTKAHEKFYISFDMSIFSQQKLAPNQPWLGGVGLSIRNFSNRTKSFPVALACCDIVEIGSLSQDVNHENKRKTTRFDNLFAREWLGGWCGNISKIKLYADIWKTKQLTSPNEILKAGDLYREDGSGYILSLTDQAELSYLIVKEYLKEYDGKTISDATEADKRLFTYVNTKIAVCQRKTP